MAFLALETARQTHIPDPHIEIFTSRWPTFRRVRMASIVWVGLVAISSYVLGQDAAAQEGSTPQVHADTIQPVGEIEKVRGDFQFTEGPAWDPKRQVLYFTDIPPAIIYQLDQEGNITTFQPASNHSNGLLVVSDGRLLACEMDGQVVSYDSETRKRSVLVSTHEGSRFNACNDLIMDKVGGIYFTDPLFRAPTPLPQTIQAVYYLDSNGKVTRVTEGIAAPNGIALSPDGKTLYVIPSQQAEMLAYQVKAPGMLTDKRVFCTLKQPDGKEGTGGDGMVVDVQGNLYLTTHLGIQIFSPTGKPLGVIEFPEQPANVTFGDEDRQTMYVTARTGLYRVRMPIAGLAPN